MIRNMRRHKVEEVKEDKQWSMWQAEQLKSLEQYKQANRKKYGKQFRDINTKIDELIRISRTEGEMSQEVAILNAIKKGFPAKKAAAGATAEFFRINDRKLDALIKATTQDMQRAETAILRMADDQYRRIIYNAQVYANSGAGTYEKAVDMAIRTASKRAYLQGEGQKRQEWGISTVIMNKRGNPCPKCLPFVGKILIDDVWSGGSHKDGKYPLMSSAIAAGIYHPRCKDSHTTCFDGISTPPDDGHSKIELDQIEKNTKEEAKQQYAERQAEKFDRLKKYSLDEENQKQYAGKEKAWKSVVKSYDSGIMKSDKDLQKYLGKDIVKTDNQSIREWYYANVNDIPNQIDRGKTFEDQVRQAFDLRNKYKHEARAAMSDVTKAKELDETRPAPTFESLVESKMKRKGMTRNEALEDILETASKTNADVNKEFGL